MRLVVFDMDGTLIDSQYDITESINYVRQEHYGLSGLTCKYVVEVINREERNLAKLFYETDTYEHSARKSFEAHYHEQCVKNPRLYEGIEETLQTLKSQGYVMSVATNAPSAFASRMITHLGVSDYFDHIVGADLVASPKPDPDMLHLIFERYGFDGARHQGWMVGDNSKDMGSAKNAGISGIFATWGFSQKGEGDYIASHPSEILDIVLQ